MIYQPNVVFDPRPSIVAGVIYAAIRAALDFIAEDNKPWTYYLGSALGGTALATGIPGAAATLYAVGNTVDLLLLKSPEGSDVRIFLNGIEQAQLDAFALAASWVTLNVGGLTAGMVNRIDIVNNVNTNGEKTSSVNWLAIGPVTVNGGYALEGTKTLNTIVWRLKDVEEDTQLASFPVNIPDGFTLAQMQTYADALGPELDAATGSKIMEVSVVVGLTVHAGAKVAPVAGTLNERGGLITFSTAGPRGDSVRIPGIRATIMPGDSFALTGVEIAALITRLTTQSTAANIRPVTAQNYNFVAGIKGKKSFRK